MPNFYEIWNSEQIEHANLVNLVPVFMKFGNLDQSEHANYEHSTWN